MHVQVVTYRVEDVTDADFVEANKDFAEAMAAVPGLLAKVWLKRAGGRGPIRWPVPVEGLRGL